MVKCVVSGCPNRAVPVNRGGFQRPFKRFFNFPKNPARVKVWLAALRETDKQDSAEHHLICEDHFLPEDISISGVNSDAIPIMPPCLDGALSMASPWGAESSEEEDQWATGGGGGDDGDNEGDEGGGEGPVVRAEPPAAGPPQQDLAAKKTPGAKTSSVSLHQKNNVTQTKRVSSRQEVSLGVLTQRFLELMRAAPDGSLDLRQVTTSLQTRRRRVYDITNVLEGISLIEKESANRIKWRGKNQISHFLWKNQQKFQRELDNLKLVEDTLDGLIKSCAQQLFDMTDDLGNAASAYVTHEDICRLRAFQEQKVIVVKAPEDTKLEIPAPKEDSIQVHLKGGKGPIMVLACDVGAGGDVSGETSGCFLSLEESRIKTTELHTECSNPQSAVQSS